MTVELELKAIVVFAGHIEMENGEVVITWLTVFV